VIMVLELWFEQKNALNITCFSLLFFSIIATFTPILAVPLISFVLSAQVTRQPARKGGSS
jgi:hypothetical protein